MNKLGSYVKYLCMILLTNNAMAMNLERMLVISDESGNGSFVMTNNKEQTYFIETGISEIITDENGDYSRVKFSQDNVSEWDVVLSNHKLIVEPGRTKSIGVKAICGNQCDFSSDKTYEVTLVPKPYSQETKDQQTVNVFIGYAPIFIIPAKEPRIDYDIKINNDLVKIHNKSNTLIKVMIDNCKGEKSSRCSRSYTLVKGRAKELELPEDTVGEDLNITVFNHDESYREKSTVINDG